MAGRRFDLVVSNPPYVAAGDEVDPEVAGYEPALGRLRRRSRAGQILERLATGAPGALRPGGRLAVELGDGQAPWFAERLAGLGYADVAITRDLRGVERVVTARATAESGRAACAERGPRAHASARYGRTGAGYPGRVPLRLDLAEPRVDLAPLAAALAQGACAVIPTDTVYGLVCDAGQPEACARLSAIKAAGSAAALDRDVREPEDAETLLAPLAAEHGGAARGRCSRGVRPCSCPTPGRATCT